MCEVDLVNAVPESISVRNLNVAQAQLEYHTRRTHSAVVMDHKEHVPKGSYHKGVNSSLSGIGHPSKVGVSNE